MNSVLFPSSSSGIALVSRFVSPSPGKTASNRSHGTDGLRMCTKVWHLCMHVFQNNAFAESSVLCKSVCTTISQDRQPVRRCTPHEVKTFRIPLADEPSSPSNCFRPGFHPFSILRVLYFPKIADDQIPTAVARRRPGPTRQCVGIAA